VPSSPTPAEPPFPALGSRRRRPLEQLVLLLLAAAGTVSIFISIGIVLTLLGEGVPFFTDHDVSLWSFLSGTTWQPVTDQFGVFPLLWASIYIALIAAAVAIPLGLGSAIYLAEYAPAGVRKAVRPILEVLGGMPTIVLGFFALNAVTPTLQSLHIVDETQIFNALSAGIVVGVLITPLITSLSEDAMRAVPNAMREGAFGVGATRRVVSTRIVFPAALSGITAGIVLGLSRAVGETMAVTLAAGAQPNLTADPTQPMQTITAYIVQVARGEAQRGSVQYQSVFAVGLVLFVVTILINMAAVRFVRRFRTVYQ
jgi:phosphate transport system permease protein